MAMSHKSTIRYINDLVSNYDEPVKQWWREIGDVVWKVMKCIYTCNFCHYAVNQPSSAHLSEDETVSSGSSSHSQSSDTFSSLLPPSSSFDCVLDSTSDDSNSTNSCVNADISLVRNLYELVTILTHCVVQYDLCGFFSHTKECASFAH